jgi:HEAT repeat protein
MPEQRSPDDVMRGFKEIEALSDEPNRAGKITRMLAFGKLMKSLEGPEYDKVLYDLLGSTQDPFLRGSLRSLFSRRTSAESFLTGRLHSETDPRMQAEALQALGAMHSKHAAQAARDFLNHQVELHRKTALLVLGWVGDAGDIPPLEERMLNEKLPDLRLTAASALRQIAWHRAETKEAVLRALKEGFEHEKNEEVLPWIIVMIATVAAKNLGLREDKDDPDVLHGDLNKARKRTDEFVKTL